MRDFVCLFVCHMKYPYSCFSSNFCFLIFLILLIFILLVLFLVFTFLFFMQFSCPCTDVSTLSSRQPFLDTSCLSLSSLGYNASCIVIRFLELSRPFVEVFTSSILRMVPSILQGEHIRCLFFWWYSYCNAWFSESSLVPFLFPVRLFDGVCFKIFPSTCKLTFLQELKVFHDLAILFLLLFVFFRCPWCKRYRRRKWTRWHKFKYWTRLIAFHIALILLGKVWIQLFSLQLWVNSRIDLVLQAWWGN